MNNIQANQSGIDYIEQFVESVRDQIQHAYDWYRGTIGMSDYWFDIFSPMFISMTVFWVVGGLFSLLDIFQWPAFLYQYKMQDKKVTVQEVIATAKVVLTNQLTVQLATAFLFQYLFSMRKMDISPQVPPLGTILHHLAACAVIQETVYYYIHRMFHYGIFYRLFHKIHHHWQAPIAISVFYSHPVEYFIAIIVPVMLGPLIMGSHHSVLVIWLVIAQLFSLNDHNGYHFPLMISPEIHDYHHLKFNENFGQMGLWDYLHGTNKNFLKSEYSKRHQVLLSLTPIKVLIPIGKSM